MCLIAFAWRHRREYPLVVAANRDEYFERPSAPAGFWPEAPQVLAGRDLVGGGTWLGITRTGRFAAVTNFRDPSERRSGAPSRGQLVRDFLLGTESPAEYLARLREGSHRYQGFNLLAGDPSGLLHFCNRDGEIRSLPPGVYGLSNGHLGSPWPKAARARRALTAALDGSGAPAAADLFRLLADTWRPEDGALPDTGVGLEWERLLSSAFIDGAGYGTRASTALWVDGNDEVEFRERSFLEGRPQGHERLFRFALAGGFRTA